MATRHEILCISKIDRNNPYERITHVGGRNWNGERWRITLQDAILGIESGKWAFYVNRGGREVDVVVATRNWYKYLKTVADPIEPNNLLSLPEC